MQKLWGQRIDLDEAANLFSHSLWISIRDNVKPYLYIRYKFLIGHAVAIAWVSVSVYLSLHWLYDLLSITNVYIALLIIAGIAYIPGYVNAFLVASLLLDKQPRFKNTNPNEEVTLIIAARNEEVNIKNTLKYISDQDYAGKIKVIVVSNNSTDNTFEYAIQAGKEYGIDLLALSESKIGKFNALNTGIEHANTEYVMTLDADTILHKSAVRYLVARMTSAPKDVGAVAGSILVKNSRRSIIARMQEWDYFLGIASIKRLQGLYQGVLVAQGAFSIYKTDVIKKIGGWPDTIGEDIVITWNILRNGYKTYFEPLAIAFTEVPITLMALSRQRSRWARGMLEALEQIKPWDQPQKYTKYLTSINLIMPYLDLVYTICWLPGLIMAMFGVYWIVGPATLLVIPLTIISYSILYIYQTKTVFAQLGLKVRKNVIGFILFILVYQMIISPLAVYGYIQEIFKSKRIWE